MNCFFLFEIVFDVMNLGNIVPPKRITRDIGMYVNLSHLNPKKKK